MREIQCNTNSKAEALKRTIKETLSLDSRVSNIDDIIEIKHTPLDKDCGSIEEWETVTCEVKCRFISSKDDNCKVQEYGTVTIEVQIKSYDKEHGEFTVEISNI